MRAAWALPFASASSSGTLATVSKNISSDVCPLKVGWVIFALCALAWNSTIPRTRTTESKVFKNNH